MNTDWVPRLRGGSVDLTLDMPFLPPTFPMPTVGGSRTGATGVPAAYVVRRDYVLGVTFRVWEEELADFLDVVAWGQGAEIIAVTLDAHAALPEEIECWLDSPLAGEDFEPPRDTEVPAILLPTLRFRRVDGAQWDFRYFSTVGIAD